MIRPLDIMKKHRAELDCEVCGETLASFVDATDDIGPQMMDVYVEHLVNTHLTKIDIEFETGYESGAKLWRYRDHNIQSGRIERSGDEFVVNTDPGSDESVLLSTTSGGVDD